MSRSRVGSYHVTLHRGSVTNLQQRCCVNQSGDSSREKNRSNRPEGAIEFSSRATLVPPSPSLQVVADGRYRRFPFKWNATETFVTSHQPALDGPLCASTIALIRVRLVPIVDAFRTSR